MHTLGTAPQSATELQSKGLRAIRRKVQNLHDNYGTSRKIIGTYTNIVGKS